MKNKILFGFAALFALILLTNSAGEKFCITYSIALNKVGPTFDGQWQWIVAASDDKGNIFMNGSWLIKPVDQPTLQFQFNAKVGDEYKTLNRGEIFAWVNVSEDLK